MDIYVINRKTNETRYFQFIYDYITSAWGKDTEDYIVIVSTKKGDIIMPLKMIGSDLVEIKNFLMSLCSGCGGSNPPPSANFQ